MPDISSMQWYLQLIYICVICIALWLDFYIVYLLIKFLRRGIRFFDHQEEDRNYRQWLARQQKNDSEKNG